MRLIFMLFLGILVFSTPSAAVLVNQEASKGLDPNTLVLAASGVTAIVATLIVVSRTSAITVHVEPQASWTWMGAISTAASLFQLWQNLGQPLAAILHVASTGK